LKQSNIGFNGDLHEGKRSSPRIRVRNLGGIKGKGGGRDNKENGLGDSNTGGLCSRTWKFMDTNSQSDSIYL